MMRTLSVLAMSDLHGFLPSFSTDSADAALTAALRPEIESYDVAVIAGDVVPASSTFHVTTKDGLLKQVRWMHEQFIPWLSTIPAKHLVITWGNHDWFADQRGGSLVPLDWFPDHCHVLVNEGVTLDGVHFYGIPQTPRFYNWAFNEDDDSLNLGRRWADVDAQTDILVTHGPPYQVCDAVWQNRVRRQVGSRTQREWLLGLQHHPSDAELESPRPSLVICGHVHASGGTTGMCGNARVYNVAVINEQYTPVRPPTKLMWTIDNERSGMVRGGSRH
jgi:Icc-related predicted phosphoesterase